MKERLPRIYKPEYEFTSQKALIFLTGVPISGKSTIAPLIAASIQGCTVQPMDILRLMAQEIENNKPENQRNPFVHYGSCDSYKIVGNGEYTPQSLIEGFMAYSRVVSSLLDVVIPRLEAQGVENLIFEGVQLTPSIVLPHLKKESARLVIIRTNESRLMLNRKGIFGDNREMNERYSIDRLLILQNEILRQGEQIDPNKLLIVDNNHDYTQTSSQVIQFLSKTGLVKKIGQF